MQALLPIVEAPGCCSHGGLEQSNCFQNGLLGKEIPCRTFAVQTKDPAATDARALCFGQTFGHHPQKLGTLGLGFHLRAHAPQIIGDVG